MKDAKTFSKRARKIAKSESSENTLIKYYTRCPGLSSAIHFIHISNKQFLTNNKNKQDYSSGNLQRNGKEKQIAPFSFSLLLQRQKKEDFSHTAAIVSTFKDRKSWRRENRLTYPVRSS